MGFGNGGKWDERVLQEHDAQTKLAIAEVSGNRRVWRIDNSKLLENTGKRGNEVDKYTKGALV